MAYLSEKAAYLKGLADGMKLAEKSDEGMMITKLIAMLEDVAASVDEMDAVLDEYDERLDDLEAFATDVSEACSGHECDCDCDCDCEDEEDEYDDLEFYEVECPHCKEKVYFDEDMMDSDDLICPNCNKSIEIEIDA
ncbi:MAG: hypothetical protein E7400_02845 [Ruminococcaceae bacterium]|nr:hypothetical protein [Oscillospiraceae bacterium]